MSARMKVLLLDDLAADAERAVRELERSGIEVEARRVDTEEGLADALAGWTPDIVISDYQLQQLDGLTAIRRARSMAPGLPFIFLTGAIDGATAVDCMKEGASDCVLKQQVSRLPAAVRDALERARVLRENEAARADVEHALARQGLQSRALDAAANAIIITDRAGAIIWANPAFEWLTGYTVDEVLGQNPRILKSGKQDTTVYRELWETLLRGQVWHGVVVNRRKDGALYSERMTVTPVTDGQGEITHFIAVKEDVTEQQRADVELRESQRTLATLLGNLPGMAYRCRVDPSWTVEVVSEGCRALTGRAPEELVGNARLSYNDLIHPIDRAAVRREVSTAISEGRPFELEYRITRADGQLRWVWERGVGVKGAGGTVAWLEGFVADITDRRRAEERARANQDRLAALVDLGRRPFESEQELVSVALDEAVRLTGSTIGYLCFVTDDRVDLEAFEWSSGAHGAADGNVEDLRDTLELAAGAADCLNLGRPVVHDDSRGFEERPVSSGGGRRFVRHISAPVIDGDRVQMVAGVADKPSPYDELDLLQLQLFLEEIWRMIVRRRAESALEASEERYRRFFVEDLTGDFISRVDGTLVDCNPAFAAMFGYDSVEEALAAPAAAFYSSPGIREDFLNRIRRERRVERLEIERLSKSGEPVHLIANVLGSFDGSGELSELQGYLFDITSHKRVEEQLRQAQKMEALGRLAGGIAHDFNNLLSVVMTFGGFLGDALSDDGARGDLEQILEAARRGAGLTEQLLEFARPRTTGSTTDLADAVRRTESMVRRVLGEDIRLEVDLEDGLPEVRCDAGQVEQVLMNLVLNARDAMPDGGVLRLAVARRAAPESGGDDTCASVELRVADTGVGIAPEQLPRLFEPFFTTKPKGSGTGLGLATAYGIVSKHDGTISVDSTPGRGSTFTVNWPAAASARGPVGVRAEPPSAAAGVVGRKATVLVVEDDTALRSSVVRALELSGYHVLSASNAGDARLMSERYPGCIALLLTDVVMPHMGGPELAEIITATRPDIQVLFMTGYASDDVLERLDRHGPDRVLRKPFTPAQLRQRVDDLIGSEVDAR